MPARILIADDSPLVLSLLKRLLESHSEDWKVCAEAANGLQAVQRTAQTNPDLVILDLEMPLMDGLSASMEITRLMPEIPILMSTLHKSEHLDLEAKMAGVREVISKSDPAALLSAVEAVLSGNPKRGQTNVPPPSHSQPE